MIPNYYCEELMKISVVELLKEGELFEEKIGVQKTVN